MTVFVYGTLLQGMSRANILNNSQFLGIGYTCGKLYDLGCFPAINPGSENLYGELYQIDEQKLNELDWIEGYNPIETNHSLYIRKEVDVVILKDGSYIRAYTYFYNDYLEGDSKKITCGDYRRYLLEKEDLQWYVAYGSNMSSQRLEERIGDYSEIKKGFLKGYQLVFNKNAMNNNETYANISYNGSDDKCPFVAYRVTLPQLQQLDLNEGEPNHYKRIGIEFFDIISETSQLGQIYIANTKMLIQNPCPSSKYLNYIYQGYEEHGFDTTLLPKITM